MSQPRYYPTTSGQDHIPDPWAWLDPTVTIGCFVVGLSMWVGVIARVMGWI